MFHWGPDPSGERHEEVSSGAYISTFKFCVHVMQANMD